MSITNLFAAKTALELGALVLPKLSHFLLGSVDGSMHLVEGVLLALLEFLSAEIHTLVSAKTRVLLFDLRKTSFLECGIGGLESSLGVTVDLGGILRG